MFLLYCFLLSAFKLMKWAFKVGIPMPSLSKTEVLTRSFKLKYYSDFNWLASCDFNWLASATCSRFWYRSTILFSAAVTHSGLFSLGKHVFIGITAGHSRSNIPFIPFQAYQLRLC